MDEGRRADSRLALVLEMIVATGSTMGCRITLR